MKSMIPTIFAMLGWLSIAQGQDVSAQNWSQWRGPLATGEALTGDPPIEWSEHKNVRWKTALPGKG
jgi:hypothetical protein